MDKSKAFLFPGQGAQYPGMGKDFYLQFPIARQTFQEVDAYLNRPFSKLIFEGPQDELTLTKNSQLAIYTTSLAIFRVVQELFPECIPNVCAGLSLGEYTALTASGKIAFSDCIDLVRTRGEAMHAACEQVQGGMQVVLGLSEQAIVEVLKELEDQPLWIANLNCPGQIVIAGTPLALKCVAEPLKRKGAKRLLPLEVAGAFHSGLMSSAQEVLATKIQSMPFAETNIDCVMNVPGNYVSSVAEMKMLLIDQVVCPVRWEQGIQKIEHQNIDVYIEMGPGKSLSGMNKRIGVKAPTLSIEKIEDLQTLEEWYAVAAR